MNKNGICQSAHQGEAPVLLPAHLLPCAVFPQQPAQTQSLHQCIETQMLVLLSRKIPTCTFCSQAWLVPTFQLKPLKQNMSDTKLSWFSKITLSNSKTWCQPAVVLLDVDDEKRRVKSPSVCLCSSQPDLWAPGAELGSAGRGPDPPLYDPQGRGDLHAAHRGTGAWRPLSTPQPVNAHTYPAVTTRREIMTARAQL